MFNNSIGNEGAVYLADALKVNTTLTSLNLSDNIIGKEGEAYLADALKVNTTLTSLNLYVNSLGNGGSERIGIGLKRNREVFEVLENSKKRLLGLSKENSKKLSSFGNCHFIFQWIEKDLL